MPLYIAYRLVAWLLLLLCGLIAATGLARLAKLVTSVTSPIGTWLPIVTFATLAFCVWLVHSLRSSYNGQHLFKLVPHYLAYRRLMNVLDQFEKSHPASRIVQVNRSKQVVQITVCDASAERLQSYLVGDLRAYKGALVDQRPASPSDLRRLANQLQSI